MIKAVVVSTLFFVSFWGIAEPSKTLEVIEVSAQKRTQNINEIPLSVTSLDGSMLEQHAIQNSYQLNGLSPNVLISENAGAGSPAAVTIRGVGLIDYNTSNTSPIAFYFDEAIAGSVNNQFSNLFDIRKVEILRGPQGTLFGRNTSGGAVLIFSQQPEQDFSAYITAGIGTDAYERLEGMINIPLTENSATRLSVQHLDYDFTATNNLSEAPQEGLKQQSLRWQYALNLDSLSVNLKLNSSNWDGITQPYGHTGVIHPETGERCQIADALNGLCTDAFGFNDGSTNFRDVRVDNNSPHKTNQTGITLNLNWQTDVDTSFSSITAFSDLSRQHTIHCDASDRQICVGKFGIENQTFSQEFRVEKQIGQAHWIAGLFFFNEQIDQDNSIDLLREFRAIGPNFGSAQYFYDNSIEAESSAIFTQFDYPLSSKTSVSIGLRYDDEDLTFLSDTRLNSPTAVQPEGVTSPFWLVQDTQQSSEWSGKLALHHEVTANLNLFASVSNGTKSGGFNGGFLFSQEEAENAGYEPENLYSYEIGSKADFWARKARLAVSAFYYDYRNQQTFINQPSSEENTPNLQLLKNVPKSTIAGIESEFAWQVTPAFNVNMTAGYIPVAKFNTFVDQTGKALSGNRQPFTPEVQFSIAADYVHELPHGNILFNVLNRFQSKIYFDQNQNPFTQQNAYSVWDANIAFQSNHEWRVQMGIKNVFDEKYDTLRFDLSDFLGLINSNKGESRRLLLEFSYDFNH